MKAADNPLHSSSYRVNYGRCIISNSDLQIETNVISNMRETHPMVVAHPYALDDNDAYRRWRDEKLAAYPRSAEDLVVEVRNPLSLSASEAGEIQRVCSAANMAIYASPLSAVADKDIPRRLGERLGLLRLDANPLADDDGISSLNVVPGKSARGYIPYSNQRLQWHTDGYYNPPEARIHAFILHCVQAAAAGGENRLLDHEIAYVLLRDADPRHIQALTAPDAMTVPANTEEGAARPAQTGPVFSVDAESGNLHMRYTARSRSIAWKTDALTSAALQFLQALLNGDSPYVFTHRLSAGQGLVCNNVLHNRNAFEDAPDGKLNRLMYRARYRDRIAATDLNSVYDHSRKRHEIRPA